MLGRIPSSLLDEIRVKANLLEWVETRLNVKLKRSGAQWVGRCPFHQEKTPSFFVNPIKQRYHCFGCGKQGDIIQFLIEQGMTFQDAVSQLAEQLGLADQLNAVIAGEDNTVKQMKPLYTLLNKASTFYTQQFKAHPKGQLAIDYLKNRGITGITAKRFRLGFAPPGGQHLHALAKMLTDTSDFQQMALQCGLMIPPAQGSGPYARFRNRIVFPVSDLRGRVLGFGGRVLDDSKPKYLNSPETPLFHKSHIIYGLYEAKQANPQGLENLLVVEGYFDVVSLSQAGITRVVATQGTALAQHQLDLLFQHTDDLCFGFDGDTAGQEAAWKALLRCLPYLQDGKSVGFVFFPAGEDPDSFLKKVGHAAFVAHLARRRSLPDFLFETIARGINLNQIDGRAKLVSLGKPLLAQLPPGVFKDMMLSRLAELSGIKIAQLHSAATFSGRHTSPYFLSKKPYSRRQLAVSSLVVRLTALLCKNPHLIADFQQLQWTASTVSPLYAFLALLQEQLRLKQHAMAEALVVCHEHYPDLFSTEQLQDQIQAMPDIDLRAEFQGVVNKLLKQQIDQETDFWLQKAKQEKKLSVAEMNHLNSLLIQRQDNAEAK